MECYPLQMNSMLPSRLRYFAVRGGLLPASFYSKPCELKTPQRKLKQLYCITLLCATPARLCPTELEHLCRKWAPVSALLRVLHLYHINLLQQTKSRQHLLYPVFSWETRSAPNPIYFCSFWQQIFQVRASILMQECKGTAFLVTTESHWTWWGQIFFLTFL